MKSRRRWRWPDGYYHEFNQGARGLLIFSNDQDRRVFLRYLGEAALKRGVTVIAYCLVGNHYHLVLRCTGEAMGKMVRDFERRYSRYFNRRTGLAGTLFRGRFGSTWLPDLHAVAYVTRYVHGNARDLGLSITTYPWSSVGAFLGWADVPRWLDPKPVLDYVGGSPAYRQYLTEIPPKHPKQSPEDAAQAELIRHIADRIERLAKNLAIALQPRSFKAVVAWAGRKYFALRPRILAKALGYGSGDAASVAIHRLEKRLERLPKLRALLDQVIAK